MRTHRNVTAAEALAVWAHRLDPSDEDLALAERSLRDTVAVAIAAGNQPLVARAGELGRPGAWAVAAHVLDFDDLHVESTAHVSAVIVPVTLAVGGDATTYLAGAGVMARIGSMLGWSHYARGWHTTSTAGAPAAAVAAALAMGLDETETAHALALAVPGAGGVQRAFGTDAKALQVGMAADAGFTAAALAARGARADLGALDQWLELVGAASTVVDTSGPAVPGGLAVKFFPCCYAMQRPIHAVRAALGDCDPSAVERVTVLTPAAAVQPLIHHRPRTGLEAKFSLEYGVATALLDGFPTLESFTDEQVRRPAAAAIMESVAVDVEDGGAGLLDGTCEVVLHLSDGSTRGAAIDQPPGSPGRPPNGPELDQKIHGCGPHLPAVIARLSWRNAVAGLDGLAGQRAGT